MMQSVLHSLARILVTEARSDLLPDIFNLNGVCYNLIEIRLRIAVIIDGLEDFLAEMIHCFRVGKAVRHCIGPERELTSSHNGDGRPVE